MDKTKNIGLALTPEEDTQKTFRKFRKEMAGDDDHSNMMLLDSAYGRLYRHQTAIEEAQFTWGMLREGFPKIVDEET